MKYFNWFAAILIAILIASAYDRKCVHDFVAVESDTIKIEKVRFWDHGSYTITEWPSGLQEGKQLICVKCFLKRHQVLDYGKAWIGVSVPTDSLAFKLLKLMGSSLDTNRSWGSGGVVLLKIDSANLIWDTVSVLRH